jgi:DNA-binding NarL/FixJ family response regulator
MLIRQAMHGVLKKLKRDATILEASNWASATTVVANNSDIDLIILDLTLPDKDGFEALSKLRESHPSTSVVVVSALQEPAYVKKALGLGALGYIPKSAKADVMLGALRLVLSGSIYVPPEILDREEISNAALRPSAGDRQRIPLANVPLTDRQLDVLELVMQGKSNKTICRTLRLAEPTVKNHVTAILKALNVSNRTEAAIAANELGWKRPAGAEE